jgi:hypothetical protein
MTIVVVKLSNIADIKKVIILFVTKKEGEKGKKTNKVIVK